MLKDIPGMRIVAVCRDMRERIWAWSHLGERKLLWSGEAGATAYMVEGIDALRAFWPDASFDGKTLVEASATRR